MALDKRKIGALAEKVAEINSSLEQLAESTKVNKKLERLAKASGAYLTEINKLTDVKKLPEGTRYSLPLRFPYVASDINRILILEAMSKESGGLDYTKIYYDSNSLAGKYECKEGITTAILSYHIRSLEKEIQNPNGSLWELTPEGRIIARIIKDVIQLHS